MMVLFSIYFISRCILYIGSFREIRNGRLESNNFPWTVLKKNDGQSEGEIFGSDEARGVTSALGKRRPIKIYLCMNCCRSWSGNRFSDPHFPPTSDVEIKKMGGADIRRLRRARPCPAVKIRRSFRKEKEIEKGRKPKKAGVARWLGPLVNNSALGVNRINYHN